jgi:L-fuconolactonase
MTSPGRVIDAHVHLWDPDHLRYPWLDTDAAMRRPFLPADLRIAGGALECIVVQAEADVADPLAEVIWIGDLARSEPALLGTVVRAPVEIGRGVAAILEQMAALPNTVGVRRLIQDEPLGFSRTPAFIDGVRAVGEFRLPFELCVRAPERADLAFLIDACPDVSFVLDHLGKPDIGRAEWEPWRHQLSELARRPNVTCKLSGSTSEAGLGWQAAQVRPYLEHALESFGASRCMFGSDWPVSSTTTSYRRWFDLVDEVVGSCSRHEVDDVFAGTAHRIYALSPPRES